MLLRSILVLGVATVLACASSSGENDVSNVAPTVPATAPSGNGNGGVANTPNPVATSPVATKLPAAPAPPAVGAAIVAEIERELGILTETHYQHTTHVVEEEGVFDVDCSGFVDYVLAQAAPTQLTAFTSATKARPLAEDYVSFLAQSPSSDSGWTSVGTVEELVPGDLVSWLLPAGSSDTGHVMVVRDAPRRRNASSFIVPIWDSVDSPHGSTDSRAASHATGIGYGEIVLLVDVNGVPTGHEWSDGGAQVKQQTALGRAL